MADAVSPTKQSPRPGVAVSPVACSGMYGQAEVILPTEKKCSPVPAGALIRDGVERYVLVEEGPGQYARRNIVPGRTLGGFVEVRRGDLVPADRVVTTGSHELVLLPQTVFRPSKEAEQTIGLRIEPAGTRSIAETSRSAGSWTCLPAAKRSCPSR